MRGYVIKESLRRPESLIELPIEVERSYSLPFNGEQLTGLEVRIPDDRALDVVLSLAEGALLEGYFAHFPDEHRMLVVFPFAVATVRRGDPDSERLAQEIGARFGIPAHRLRATALFETNRPNLPDLPNLVGA